MRKHLYLIKKAKIKSWLKFWLLTKDQVKYILSEILEGFSFNLQNTVKKYFKIFNIFGNSVQDGTPTPSNPVEIESVADDVNLFTTTNNFVQIVGYANYEILGTNSLSVSATGTTYSYRYVKFKLENLIVGKTYYLKAKATNTNSEASKCLYVRNSADDTTLNSSEDWQDNSVLSFVPTETTVIIRFYANGNTAVINTCVWSDIKISTFNNTPYSPYNYGTFTIDFEGQTENYNYTFITKPLRSLPNGVRDTIEADGIHRRVGRQILGDVTELIEATIFGTPSKFASYVLQNAKNENRNYNFMSDKLFYANEQFIKYGTYRNQTALIVLTTIDDTVENFNSKISGSEVLYELAEEIIEPYTEEQQAEYNKIKELYTFEGTTNIYSTDVVPPYLQIQYYMKGE